jgi:short-subunit dehydrogenase
LEEHLAGIDVNCRTPAILSYRFAKKMVERGRGSIVLVTSMGALQGMRNFVSYSASKAYECILAEGLWDEVRDRGVDVLAYVVGASLTPKYIQQRPEAADPALREKERWLETPEEVAVRLLEVIDQGPRQFTSTFYERMAKMTAGMTRGEAVKLMGKESSVLARET